MPANVRTSSILLFSCPLSFVFGTIPLVIATGAGANARRDLGTAVFGGMLVATVVGILLIPIFYVVVQKITERLFAGGSSAKHGE